MEDTGEGEKSIRRATGWEKGADGKWRYEIDDIDITGDITPWTDEWKGPQGYVTKLTDLVSGKLIKAYPQLKKVYVGRGLTSDSSFGTMAQMLKRRTGWDIYMSDGIFNGDVEFGKSVLIHEIQHIIQDIEGFERGGDLGLGREILNKKFSSESSLNKIIAEKLKEVDAFLSDDFLISIQQYLLENPNVFDADVIAEGIGSTETKVREATNKAIEYFGDVDRDVMQDVKSKLIDELTDIKVPTNGYEVYKRLAGEVEARNVQKRMGMTPKERQETLLKETEDVAREDQILLEGTQSKIKLQKAQQKPKLQKTSGDKETFKEIVKMEEEAIRKNKMDVDDFLDVSEELGLSLSEAFDTYQSAVDEMKIIKRQPTKPGVSVSEGKASVLDPEGYKKLTAGIKEANKIGKAEKKGFGLGKSKSKQQTREVRDSLTNFISENSKEINKMGDKLSASMLRKLARVGDNPERLREAQDYINRMMDNAELRKAESERLKSISDIEDAVSKKSLLAKGGKSPKAKASGPTAEVIAKMGKINAVIEMGNKHLDAESKANKLEAKLENLEKRFDEGKIDKAEFRESKKELKQKLEQEKENLKLTSKEVDAANKESLDILEGIETDKYEGEELNEKLDRLDELSYIGIHDMSKTVLDAKLKDIQETIKTGKDVNKVIRDQQNFERQKRKSDVDTVLDPESKAKVSSEEKHMVDDKGKNVVEYKEKKKKIYDLLKQDSWYSLLDKLSRYDKESGMFNSYMSNELGGMTARSELGEGIVKREMSDMTSGKLSEIYKGKSDSQIRRILEENSKEQPFEYTDEKGKTYKYEVSKNQLYKKYQELEDPSLNETHFENGYKDFDPSTGRYVLSKKGQAVYDALTPELKEWADWQLKEFYPWVHSKINPVYKRMHGVDLPKNEMYSPIFREGVSFEEADLFASDSFTKTAANGNLISRVGSKKNLKWVDGDQAMYQYFDKMNFYSNWAETIKNLDGVFKDTKIRESIKQLHGVEYLPAIDGFIEDFARKKIDSKFIDKTMDNIRKNLTTSTLSLKPAIAIKQLTSIPAYAQFIPVHKWGQYSASFWANPKKNWDKLMESEYLKDRYSVGFERDMMLAMSKDAKSIMTKKSNFKDQLMVLTKWGDRAAIITGGWAVYKHNYNENIKSGMNPKQADAAAMTKFEMATRLTQQASATSDLSAWQRSGSIPKLLTMYMTSPMQYHRMASAGMRNLIGGRGSKAENLKAIAIYHFLLPQLFSAVSTALPRAIQGSDDPLDFITGGGVSEDDKSAIIQSQLTAAAVGNFNSIVIAGDVAEFLVSAIGEQLGGSKGFDYQPSPLMREVERTKKGLELSMKQIESLINGDEIKWDDVIEATDVLATPILKATTGMPIPMAKSVGKGAIGLFDDEEIGLDEATRILLGYSDWSAGEQKEKKKKSGSSLIK
jgi:hypothetical protein